MNKNDYSLEEIVDNQNSIKKEHLDLLSLSVPIFSPRKLFFIGLKQQTNKQNVNGTNLVHSLLVKNNFCGASFWILNFTWTCKKKSQKYN